MNEVEYRRCDLCYGHKIIKGGGMMDVTCHRCNGVGKLIIEAPIDDDETDNELECESKTHVQYKRKRGRPKRKFEEED